MRKRWLLAALCDINRLRGPGESSGGGLSLTETFVRANHLEAHVPVEVLLHRESQGVGHDATPRGLAGPQGHGPSGHAHLEVLDHISPLREPWKTEKMVLCGGLHSGGVNRGRGGEARGPYEKNHAGILLETFARTGTTLVLRFRVCHDDDDDDSDAVSDDSDAVGICPGPARTS